MVKADAYKISYICHKLYKYVGAYDGSYEKMRKLRAYVSVAFGSSHEGKPSWVLIRKLYPQLADRVKTILTEHGQVVRKDDLGFIITNSKNGYIECRDCKPTFALVNLIKFKTRFPEVFEEFGE